MKQPRIQQMQVTRKDGSQVVACCGPAVAAMPDVAAFHPVGEARYGACCHTGVPRKAYDLAEASMKPVRAWLATRAGKEF